MQQRATIVAVTGVRGGSGATTLACALSLAAARRGLATLLVDGDPFGGGLDLTLGVEDVPGARWPDVPRSDPSLAGLPEVALPRGSAELRVLSHARTAATSALDLVLPTARTAVDLIVLDVPRPIHAADAGAALLDEADALVLVVPAEVRACAAAVTRLRTLPTRRDVHLVVRGPGPGGLAAPTVASALGLPLAAVVAHEPRLAAAVEAGRLPDLSARSTLARASARLLDTLESTPAAAA